jgi:O-acetyl-ADP-ribose deacetylase (regulator of RNase III)
MPYYLPARPQTIIAILHTGKLPDKLPAWFSPKEMCLYRDPKQAVAESGANKPSEVWLLEIATSAEPAPALSESAAGGSSSEAATSKQVFAIDPKQIRHILVASSSAEKLLLRILNSKTPAPIQINAEIFSSMPALAASSSPAGSLPSEIPSAASGSAAASSNIRSCRGDLLGSRMQTLVNTVNCVGVMGKGIAFSFKNNYPDMFTDYKKRCDRHEIKLGQPYLYKVTEQRWILNFPTKDHWRMNSSLKDVEAGLKYLAENCKAWGVTSLAVPPLGCGNGNLNWRDVEPLMHKYLVPLGIPVEIYEPFEHIPAPAEKRRKTEGGFAFASASKPQGSDKSTKPGF